MIDCTKWLKDKMTKYHLIPKTSHKMIGHYYVHIVMGYTLYELTKGHLLIQGFRVIYICPLKMNQFLILYSSAFKPSCHKMTFKDEQSRH
jgi:hypothetical protein